MTLHSFNESLVRSKDLLSTIHKIRKVTGAPSISCGVLHHGKIIFTHAEGLANVEEQREADESTIYSVASNTKAFITALCGILVEESVLSWTQPVSTYLPEFKPTNDPEIGKRATLLDLCSHGTGLAPLDRAGNGFYNQWWNDGSDNTEIASNLPIAYDFRSHWLYNNFLLDVVGDVISHVCSKRSGLVLRDRILKPLGLKRTFTRNDEYPDDMNVARGYAVLDDGSVFGFGPPSLEDGSLQGASGYVRSSVKDMLMWAKAVMDAEANEIEGNDISCLGGNPLRQILRARGAHRPLLGGVDGYENSYGLGWFRHMLPSRFLSSIGPNFNLLPDPPLMNEGGPPRLTIAHWGEVGGFLSAFYTFPDTQSAVIVMSNCTGGKGDPTDLIAQVLCQDLFDMKPRVQFEAYAAQAAKTAKLTWDALVEEWVKKRVQNTCLPPLNDFVGVFVNEGLKIRIRVFKLTNINDGTSPELLGFNINSLPSQTAKLRHYHYDTWTFLPDSRDDAIRKGMQGFLVLPALLLVFIRDGFGKIVGLEWDLQAGACEGPAPDLRNRVKPIFFTKVDKHSAAAG